MVKNKLTIAASTLLLVCAFASAQYLIPWQSVNSGGAPGTGTGYILNGSTAQAVQGNGSGTGYLGYWGFWVPMPPADTTHGWKEMTKMPLVPSTKELKDGGWLAYNAGNNRIYAAKGNKTGDFYSYAVVGDSWKQLPLWPLGIEGKLPKAGSSGCSDGNGILYATKGNNTQGFWKYNATKDSWYQKKDVPLGPTNKKVKGGTGLVYASTGNVYMLKGYKNEYWKYFPTGDSWKQMADAPIGANMKYDKGSWLAYNTDDNVIYAHKAKYHEFYKYFVSGDSWSKTALVAMPIPGSLGSKKSKDGSCAAYMTGKVYSLKGGNCTEFWVYTTSSNSWKELETIPSFGSTAKKKKVKSGAGMVAIPSASPAVLYATKGNKCNELWQYKPVASFGDRFLPEHEGVMAAATSLEEHRLQVAPNPLVGGLVTLRYSLPRAGAAKVRVFDVTGRTVLSRTLNAARTGSTALDLRHLSNGVYLMKLESDGFLGTQKLVVQR